MFNFFLFCIEEDAWPIPLILEQLPSGLIGDET